MGPDFMYGWPTTEFSPTGPEQIVQAVFHKELAVAKEEGRYDEVYQGYLAPLKAGMNVMNGAASFNTYYTVQEVIDPRDTRAYVVRGLRTMANKREEPPEKKRFVKPA
jgi:acetyl-CoA carboxylase carboxyltransferase component